jgi:hypothetical protein
MALWGNNDSIRGTGSVFINYQTGIVTGTATTFGQTGAIQVGDVIRVGDRLPGGVYYGDAVVTKITSTTNLTIGSTAGLSGALVGAAGTGYVGSQLPKSSILDSKFSEKYGTESNNVYGVAAAGLDNAQSSTYQLSHAGWVGVTTYTDADGNHRVKSEVLVAMSGITTGNAPAFPPGNAYGGES